MCGLIEQALRDRDTTSTPSDRKPPSDAHTRPPEEVLAGSAQATRNSVLSPSPVLEATSSGSGGSYTTANTRSRPQLLRVGLGPENTFGVEDTSVGGGGFVTPLPWRSPPRVRRVSGSRGGKLPAMVRRSSGRDSRRCRKRINPCATTKHCAGRSLAGGFKNHGDVLYTPSSSYLAEAIGCIDSCAAVACRVGKTGETEKRRVALMGSSGRMPHDGSSSSRSPAPGSGMGALFRAGLDLGQTRWTGTSV